MILFAFKVLVIQVANGAMLPSMIVGDVRSGHSFNDCTILENDAPELLVKVVKSHHILKRDLWKESVILSQRQRVRTEPIIVHPLQDIAGIDIICDDKPSFTKQRDLFIIALERFCLVCCWHGFTSNVL